MDAVDGILPDGQDRIRASRDKSTQELPLQGEVSGGLCVCERESKSRIEGGVCVRERVSPALREVCV